MVADSVGGFRPASCGLGFFHTRSGPALAVHVFNQVGCRDAMASANASPGLCHRDGRLGSVAESCLRSGFGLAAAALFVPLFRPRGWIDGAVACGAVDRQPDRVGRRGSGNIAWDAFYAALAGLMAAAIWLAGTRSDSPAWKSRWNAAVMAWLLCGAIYVARRGILPESSAVFFCGLLATLAVLALCRLWFSWRAAGAQVMNTLILLLVGLPIVDMALRLQSRTCGGAWKHAASITPTTPRKATRRPSRAGRNITPRNSTASDRKFSCPIRTTSCPFGFVPAAMGLW